jgi:hypothetical protein
VDNVPAVIAVILTGTAMLGGLLLYVIRGEIRTATKYLQPRNGGEGWSDVHDKVTLIVNRQSDMFERQGDLVDDVKYLRARIDRHIDDHDHGRT